MLRKELDPSQNSFLSQKNPIFFTIEALRKKKGSARAIHPPFSPGMIFSDPLLEVPVAATVALLSHKSGDRIAYLALLHCANDLEALTRLLDDLFELLLEIGCRKVVGPTGISPHLGSGILQDSWHQIPPMYTPYNPPYLPELVARLLDPVMTYKLYHLNVHQDIPKEFFNGKTREVCIVPLETNTLPKDFPLLFAETCSHIDAIPSPDVDEVSFLLRWLGEWPLIGSLALIENRPVGFILMQPDLSPVMLKAKGGRNPLWRSWLMWNSRRAALHGRVLFGGVVSEWRNRGIGHHLLAQALLTARVMKWQTLRIGPIPCNTSASAFLESCGAVPQQTYSIYQRDL